MRKIAVAVPNFIGNEKKYVNECIDTTWISSNGKFVTEFEKKFAEFTGVSEALSCCNGTVALHLPLVALGIGEGDEVIVPSFTYIATANAVKYVNATPVFADCIENTWNIDPVDVEKRITDKTKAIIVVHLYGNMCDMDAIMAIAKKYNLYVIEDAAECHGAEYKGKKAGSIGHVGVFSLFGNKIITTGEGGMITTNDKKLALTMRQLKGQGMDPNRRYWFTMIGYNYRMTNIEAAIGLAQLEKIDVHMSERQRVALSYMSKLKDLVADGYIKFQEVTDNSHHVYWMFSVLFTDKVSLSRDNIIEQLQENGIETRPLFYPMHVMPPYKDDKANCPISEKIAFNGINLPTHSLLSDEDIEYICNTLKAIVKK